VEVKNIDTTVIGLALVTQMLLLMSVSYLITLTALRILLSVCLL
jgi:hypothetical protein